MNLDIKDPRVAIVIPAFNEQDEIGKVVIETSAYGTVLVVNDGSADNTEQVARAAGAYVVTHQVNRGYDKSLSTGLMKALEEQFDFAITFDGDGQHTPFFIKYFLLELMAGADMVIGIRGGYQRVSESIFASLAKILWGISDPLCGMKGYRLSKLKGIDTFCSYPSIGTELAIRAVRSGWNIRQVAVNTSERNGRSRFGAGIFANSRILSAMLLGLFLAKPYIASSKVSIESS